MNTVNKPAARKKGWRKSKSGHVVLQLKCASDSKWFLLQQCLTVWYPFLCKGIESAAVQCDAVCRQRLGALGAPLAWHGKCHGKTTHFKAFAPRNAGQQHKMKHKMKQFVVEFRMISMIFESLRLPTLGICPSAAPRCPAWSQEFDRKRMGSFWFTEFLAIEKIQQKKRTHHQKLVSWCRFGDAALAGASGTVWQAWAELKDAAWEWNPCC